MPSVPKGRKDEIGGVTSAQLRQDLVLKKQIGKGGFAAVFLGSYKGQEVQRRVGAAGPALSALFTC